jgi:hypothetical protein
MNFHNFVVIFCLTIAALMNSRAPYAALAGFPGEWRWISAILVSFPLVYFTEWAISYDVAISSIQRDIRHDQEQIELKRTKAQTTKNKLIEVRAEAEKEVFNAVLKDYLHQQPKVFVVVAIAILFIEYAATLFYVRFQGEDGDWITYIVPLLGIILTVITGFYTGKIIKYSQYQRQIAQKFETYNQQRQQENTSGIKYASREFWVLDGLTQYVLEYPQATPQQINYQENKLWIKQLNYERHKLLKKWQKAIHEQERKLSQTPEDLISREDRDHQIKEEIKAINQIYRLELYEIQDELRQRGYPPNDINGNISKSLN